MIKKMVKKVFLFLLTVVLGIFLISFVSAWLLNGTTYDTNGERLANTSVTVMMAYFPGGQPPTYYTPNTTTSDSNGIFNLSVYENSSYQYQIVMKHRNASTGAVDYVGQVLPYFPYMEMSRNISTDFFLKEAGTLNITAINSSGARIAFNYQVSDTELGFPIDSNWSGNGMTEAIVYLPKEKNYSVMIFPRQSIPLSFNWNNFSANQSYTFADSLSRYNFSTSTLHKQFNTSMNFVRVSGYVNGSLAGKVGFDEIVAIPYVLQPGNMILAVDGAYGSLPFNMSSWNAQSDSYDLETSFYNITLPGPAEPQTVIIYLSARNGSSYYGVYKNITLNYAESSMNLSATVYGLLGSTLANLSMSYATNWTTMKFATKKQTFTIANASNNVSISLSLEAHTELDVDYSSYGGMPFTFMGSVASGSSSFALALLNVTGYKELSVFSNDFAPRTLTTKTAAEILAYPNITMSTFSPQTTNGTGGSSIFMAMYKSNSTCDVPNPPNSCLIGGAQSDMSSFNPLSAIIAGGKISFRMGFGNISVHYVNVNMLASGPPDAIFDNSAPNISVGSSFSATTRFGSQGPKIYEYVLVSMPYTGSGIGGLNDSAPVNISIPILYDESWGVIWNTTLNGTDASALSANYSHYSGREREWNNLTISKRCTTANITSSTLLNVTNPCYIDTAHDTIWIRLPHFSGTGPEISGTSYDYPAARNTIDFRDPTETSGSHFNRTYFLVNVTGNVTGTTNLTIWIYNSTQNVNLTYNISGQTGLYVNVSSLSDGLWFFNASLSNETGRINSTSLRNVTVDTLLPVPVINMPEFNHKNLTSRIVGINISVTEANLNYTNYSLINSSGGVAAAGVNLTGTNFNTSLTVSYDGTFTLNVVSYDFAGNSNSTSRNLSVDTLAPTLTILSPLNNSIFYVNQSFLVSFSRTDTTAGALWVNGNGTTNVSNHVYENSMTTFINYNSTSGMQNVTFYANDTFGNTTSIIYTINVTFLPSTSTLINETQTSYNVSSTVTNVIVPYNISLQRVDLRNSSQFVTFDLSQVKGGNSNSVVVPNNFTLVTVGTNNYSIYIPAGITIYGPSGWNGKLILPLVNSTSFSAPTLTGYTTATDVVIETGGTATETNFSSPVKISFVGMAGKRAAWARGGTALSDISTVCDSATTPTNIDSVSVRECYKDSGSDLIVWTYHFTSYSAYTPTATTSTTTTSSSGGGGIVAGFWKNTYDYDDNDFFQAGALTRELSSKNRIKLKINGNLHYVGVVSLTSVEATIQVASDPQEDVLSVGEKQKFDVNNDGYYDILVSLDKIADNKATLTLTPVHELVLATIPEKEKGMGEKIKETGENIAENVNKAAEGKASTWVYVILTAIIVLVIVYLLFRVSRKNRMKKYGY